MFSRIDELLARVRDQGARLGKGAGEGQIDGFCRRSGITLPGTLRQWFQRCNGGIVAPGNLYGIRPGLISSELDLERFYCDLPMWKVHGYIPVAGDGCGSFYVVATCSYGDKGGPALFFDHEDGFDRPTYVAASDIIHFVEFYLHKALREELDSSVSMDSDLYWPFASGYVTARDPDIVNCKEAPLPWECE